MWLAAVDARAEGRYLKNVLKSGTVHEGHLYLSTPFMFHKGRKIYVGSGFRVQSTHRECMTEKLSSRHTQQVRKGKTAAQTRFLLFSLFLDKSPDL